MVLKNISFTAVFIEVPEGGFSAYVEEMPGVNSQGETIKEAKSNLEEAFYLILETNKILAQKKNPNKTKITRETLTFAS